MAKKNILSAGDHARIADTVRNVEKSTSGEIYCVVSRRSDDYFFPSAFFAGLSIMIAMVPAAWITGSGWDVGHPALLPAAGLAALATALFVLWLVPGLRILLVPRWLRYRRASSNAVAQFLSHNIHVTENRTGVLIFISLGERYAEIVADSGINAHVDQAFWNDIVASLTDHARKGELADGYVGAINAVGAELALHFPKDSGDRNELEDHLVEI